MATDNSQEIPCSKYNFFRNTNLLINLKKNKKTIFASLLVIGLISLNIYFGVLASTQQPLLNNHHTKHPGEISNLNVGIMEDMMHLKNNITYLKNIVNNQVHHDQFTQATNSISNNFNAVNAEVTKQIENFQNISFILNEFDRHKKTLEFNITTIFSLFTSHKNAINNKVSNLTKKNNNFDDIYRNIQHNISSLISSIKNNLHLIKNNHNITNKNILNNTNNYFKNLEEIIQIKNRITNGINELNSKHGNLDLQIQNHTKTIDIHREDINKNKQGYKIYIDACPENLKTFTSIGSMYLCYY